MSDEQDEECLHSPSSRSLRSHSIDITLSEDTDQANLDTSEHRTHVMGEEDRKRSTEPKSAPAACFSLLSNSKYRASQKSQDLLSDSDASQLVEEAGGESARGEAKSMSASLTAMRARCRAVRDSVLVRLLSS